jgi:hydrophobe/amphiphile efflux-3 (HAE3) family protein
VVRGRAGRGEGTQMMQRFWSVLAVTLGKRAGLVSVICLGVTLVLGIGITQLEFATGQDSYLNKDDQVAKDNVTYQDLFGGQAMLTVITMDEGHTVDELFTAENRAQLVQFHDELLASNTLHGVITPLTIAEFADSLVQSDSGDPTASIAGGALQTALTKEQSGSPEQVARVEDAGKTLERINAIPDGQRTFDNPEWVKFLLYDNEGDIRLAHRSFILDPTHAQIVTRLVGNESIETEGKASDLVRAQADKLDLENASVVTTGAPVLLKDINDYLRGGMLTLGGIAVAIMVVILLLLFKVRWRLLPLGVILVGVVWAFGLAGYLGIPLTIVTIAGLPVMLGVGIDYAIQMHARVEEEAVLDRSEHPIQETARNLGPALLVVTFDAIFAFAALRFAKVPMIRDFGLLLAVGIAAICLCSIILPLAILGIREHRSPTTGKDFREGALGKIVVFLGRVPSGLAIPLAIASVIIFLWGIAVEDDLTLQTDPVQWVNQESQAIKDLNAVEEATNSTSELGVFVQSDDVFSDETVQFVHEFTRDQLASYDGALLTGSSIETSVGDLITVPGASDIAPTGDEVRAAFEVAPDDLKVSTVSPEATDMNIVFRAGPSSLEDRAPIVQNIRDNTETPEGISLTPSGLAVVGVGLLENLEANRVELTYLALLFVFLFLAVRLRSIVRSLLSLVPVAIAVGLASIIAYTFNLKLSPMTAVGGPLVIAACTEFTSLILLRFVEERGRGYTPREAMDVTASRTGRAFIVSALTAICGVAVLSFSSLPLLRDFGRIVAMNVAVALVCALVVLPPMLVWADRRNLVSRGLIKKPQPYAEAPPVRYPAPASGS